MVFGIGSNTQLGSVSGECRGAHRGQGNHRAEGKHYVFWNSCEKLCRIYGLQGPVRGLPGQIVGITFVWAFAGGSPSSYAAVGWNHLVAGTGAALAFWTASHIFWGSGQFCCRAAIVFSDTLHHQEDRLLACGFSISNWQRPIHCFGK